MLILSGLVVKQWFKSFIGAIVVLFLLISTAELINGFLQGKAFTQVMLEYGLKLPEMIGRLLPICCLVSTLFSLNKLKAHAELISILAAGISYFRIYVLISLCALTVVALQFFNLGFLEPMANGVKRQEIKKSVNSEGRYLTRSSLDGGKFWYKSQNYFASFSFFDRKTAVLKDFEIYYFNPNHKSEKMLKAKTASFVKDGWVLDGVTEISHLATAEFPVQESRPSQPIDLFERPDDFGQFESDLTTLTFFKLQKFVKRLSKTGINVSEYEIILLNKIFLSFVCFVFALIPAAGVFNPNRRSDSFGKSVVFTLLTSVVFWVLYSSAVAYGNSGTLSPLVATGIVPLSFFSYVLWTYFKNSKLSI